MIKKKNKKKHIVFNTKYSSYYKIKVKSRHEPITALYIYIYVPIQNVTVFSKCQLKTERDIETMINRPHDAAARRA